MNIDTFLRYQITRSDIYFRGHNESVRYVLWYIIFARFHSIWKGAIDVLAQINFSLLPINYLVF